MNYTDLKTNIQDICENTFTDAQLAMFTQLAEQTIYNSVQIPDLRKNQTGTFTATNKYLVYPTDLLYVYSLAVEDSNSDYQFLIQKDANFIREAYPDATDTGLPKYYGHFSSTSFIVGPTPDSDYAVELHYGYYPESIVTASTTWLGDEFDSALLNAALVEAIRFLKGEPDVVALYEKLYAQSIVMLKNLGDGKMRQDSYRSGQVRIPVK